MPDIVESLAIALFAGDLVMRGHVLNIAGIVTVLIIRFARQIWPAPALIMPPVPPSPNDLAMLRTELEQLKNDVSRVSLVVGVSKLG